MLDNFQLNTFWANKKQTKNKSIKIRKSTVIDASSFLFNHLFILIIQSSTKKRVEFRFFFFSFGSTFISFYRIVSPFETSKMHCHLQLNLVFIEIWKWRRFSHCCNQKREKKEEEIERKCTKNWTFKKLKLSLERKVKTGIHMTHYI